MTALRDTFAVTHKKDIKGKGGVVVASVDYIGWSQAADRLDEATDSWSFAIIGSGDDWVHGRLTIVDKDGNQRHFENIGYAENADMDWKKEVLKDAASDAFKRCAALAGVGRYLYDKDAAPRPPQRPAEPQRAPTPIRADTDLLEPDDEDLAALEAGFNYQPPAATDKCPWHPDRTPKEGKYGLYCTGQGGNGPLNGKGYCNYKFAA